MNGIAAALLVVLGLSAPLHTPDLQVEAASATGAPLPELAEAVARALVAGGARVVMRGPTSGPCEYCAVVKVIETGAGTCVVEVRHEQRTTTTTLHLPAGSLLFDRARAIAIQTRLLMPPAASPEAKPKEVAARPVHKQDARSSSDPAGLSDKQAAPPVRRPDAIPYLASAREPSPVDPDSLRIPPPAPVPAAPPVPMVTYTNRGETRPPARPTEAAPAAGPEARNPIRSERIAAAKPEKPADPPKRREAGPAKSEPERAAEDAVLSARSNEPGPGPRWPWVPTLIGGGAAVAAGVCAAVARSHYNALEDKNQSIGSALSQKSAGENWQTASFILAGAAAVGVTVGLVGFSLRGSGGTSVVAAPVPGGAVVALAGELP
jgi:hypothetical protein